MADPHTIRRELQRKLAEVVGSKPLLVAVPPPQATAGPTGHHVAWETASASQGILHWREPGFAAWHQARSSVAATRHTVLLPGLRHGPVEWYLVAWDETGASARVLPGLLPAHWFQGSRPHGLGCREGPTAGARVHPTELVAEKGLRFGLDRRTDGMLSVSCCVARRQ